MIKAVIFDFDGLLADTEVISYKIYQKILKDHGHDFDQKTYSHFYSGRPEEDNVRKLIHDYQLPMNFEECFSLVMQTERDFMSEGVDLKSGVEYLLNCLKENGYQTAIASSSTRGRAMNILHRHDIDGCFDAFVFAEDITKGKPDPEIFLKAAERLDSDPSECLVLEDSESGILAAHRAGMRVICIPDMKTPADDYLKLTLAVCSDLNEVLSCI